jgi:penicillin-binding protein 1A
MATQILQQNMQRGTGGKAQIGCPAAGKTGTTDKNNDAWFTGFTPKLASAVWVGYPNAQVQMNTQYHGGPVDGGTFPAEIWGEFMKQAKGGFCGDFEKPTEPFESQPFFGKYAKTGTREDRDYTYDGTTTPAEPKTDEDGEGTGGQEYDPDLYESAPQEPPAPVPAPAPGNGNGNGNGNGQGGGGPGGGPGTGGASPP